MAEPTAAHGTPVLVTGGAGFIGSHTVDRLLGSGCRVVVLDNFSSGQRANLAAWDGDPRLEIVEADVADPLEPALAALTRRLGRIERIVHLAAQTAVGRSLLDPFEDLRTNYLGTVQVLEYARRNGVRKVVLASSSAVYGDDVALPAREDAPPRPLSPYGVDKLSGEHYLDYCRSVHGLAGTAFRFFNVYGPRQDPGSPYSGVISIFARAALAGAPLVIYGDGEQSRDFVFVGDVAQAVAETALGGSAEAAVVNLGSGEETTINALARAIIELAGSDGPVRHEAPRPGDIYRSVADIDRARSLLGFCPAVGLGDGLRQTLAWMQGGAGEELPPPDASGALRRGGHGFA